MGTTWGSCKRPGDAGFALHPLAKHRVLAELVVHQLDRDGPLLDGVLGLVDLAHPAPAQQPFEVVGPKHRPHPRVLARRSSLILQTNPRPADHINNLQVNPSAATR